jgi:hypothetical protein
MEKAGKKHNILEIENQGFSKKEVEKVKNQLFGKGKEAKKLLKVQKERKRLIKAKISVGIEQFRFRKKHDVDLELKKEKKKQRAKFYQELKASNKAELEKEKQQLELERQSYVKENTEPEKLKVRPQRAKVIERKSKIEKLELKVDKIQHILKLFNEWKEAKSKEGQARELWLTNSKVRMNV